jgi:hypothetical protein
MRTPKHEQLDEYGYEVWEENSFPLAYLLTFRTFGTWLHGDERTSVRDGWNRYGHPRYRSSETLEKWMREEMSQEPFLLSGPMRVLAQGRERPNESRSRGTFRRSKAGEDSRRVEGKCDQVPAGAWAC